MKPFIALHLIALRDALRRLKSAPLNTLLSFIVIGTALALPSAGWVVLDNLGALTGHFSGVQEISIFMTQDALKKDVADVESRLREGQFGTIRFIPREEALKHLQSSEGLAEIVASLPKNPLPDAFIITPANTHPEHLETLAQTFKAYPKVAHVQLDSAWIKRLNAFFRVGKLALWLLGALFSGALIAVTFNTIRLQILAQAAEIEVARLIGATDSFIRRPFFYFGALQGACGGLVAALLVAIGTYFLSPAVEALVTLYGSSFIFHTLSWGDMIALCGIGAALGWCGALLSVSIQLRT